MNSRPQLVVLSGPSGVGKDSILAWLKAAGRPFHYTVTATTRPRRKDEVDGRDYFFYTERQFEGLIEHAGLLEHACVYQHQYGVPKAPVLAALRRGEDVIMRTDVQGALSIKRDVPGAVLIFVAPPSRDRLEEQLRSRETESQAEIAVRLGKFREEMAAIASFDYMVVNFEGELERAAAAVDAIVLAEKCRINPPPLGLV